MKGLAKKKAQPQPSAEQEEPKKSKRRAPRVVVDPRVMERSLAHVHRVLEERAPETPEEAQAILDELMASGEIPQVPPRSPLEQAQEIMYDAWEARGAKRAKLAREALKVSPDCADAYVLLAEETARTAQEAHDLFEQGVKAGERVLGARMFQEEAGNFWGILETRPYMRARAGLAWSLWAMGKRQEAIDHLWDLLRLNPNDNQGNRYALMAWLLATGDDAGARRLLDQYADDPSAGWAYNRAILLFRKVGDTAKSSRALDKALGMNPFVPLYLIGVKAMPSRMPGFVQPGGESEAIEYVGITWEVWFETPGALDWLVNALDRKIAALEAKVRR